MCPKISDCTCFSDRAFKGRRPCFTTPMLSQNASLTGRFDISTNIHHGHLGVPPSRSRDSPELQVIPLCSFSHRLNARPRCMRSCEESLHRQGRMHKSTRLGQHPVDRIHHSLRRVCRLLGHLVSTIRLLHTQDASTGQGCLGTSRCLE